MSGHSKWSTIKRKKGAADQKRGKEFSKLIRVIVAAAREGGGDIESNGKLRTAIDKARSINMPKDTMTQAIKRGTGEIEGMQFEELNYEGYGPGGIALLIETVTDNRNRTTADIRHLLSKYGGSLGETGCVQWMFNKKGVIYVPAAGTDEDKLTEIGIEAGADDVAREDESFRVTCEPSDFETLKKALEAGGFKIEESEISMEPQTTIKLDRKQAESVLRLMGMIEENDDVENVYSNFDISDEIMAQLDQ